MVRAARNCRRAISDRHDHCFRGCCRGADGHVPGRYRGWQPSGVLLEAGQTYEITATGRFTLAELPKPWESEPGGISFRYFDGRPLGTLLGCLRTEEGPVGEIDDPMLNVIVLGSQRSFIAPVTGTLYLRLNDAWNSLGDNRGHATVIIRKP